MRVTRGVLPVIAVIAGVAVGCGDETDGGDVARDDPPTQTAPQTQTAAKQAAKRPGPEVCLLRGQASDVERRGATLRGTLPDGGGLLRVKRFGSAAEAREGVREATDIDAASAGRHAVFGTLKGRGSAEGVETVADCLKNG